MLAGSARVAGETPLGLVAAAFASAHRRGAATEAADRGRGRDGCSRGGVAAPARLRARARRARSGRERRRSRCSSSLDDVDAADRGSLELRALPRPGHGDRARCSGSSPPSGCPGVFDAAIGGDDDRRDAAPRAARRPRRRALSTALLPGVLDLRRSAPARPPRRRQPAVRRWRSPCRSSTTASSPRPTTGAWMLTGDPDAVRAPGSVAELVEARIDRSPTQAAHHAAGRRRHRPALPRAPARPGGHRARWRSTPSLAELADAELVVPPPGRRRSARRSGRSAASSSARSPTTASCAGAARRPPGRGRGAARSSSPTGSTDNVDLLAPHFELCDDPPLADPPPARGRRPAPRRRTASPAPLDRARRALAPARPVPRPRRPTHDAAWFLEHLGVARSCARRRGRLDDLQHAVELSRPSAMPVEEAAARRARRLVPHRSAGDPASAGHHLAPAQELADERRLGRGHDGARSPRVAGARAFSSRRGRPHGDLDGAFDRGRRRRGRSPRARATPSPRPAPCWSTACCWLWEGKPGEALDLAARTRSISRGSTASRSSPTGAAGGSSLADRRGRQLRRGARARRAAARPRRRARRSVSVGRRARRARRAVAGAGRLEQARALATEAVATSRRSVSVAVDAAAEAHLMLSRSSHAGSRSPSRRGGRGRRRCLASTLAPCCSTAASGWPGGGAREALVAGACHPRGGLKICAVVRAGTRRRQPARWPSPRGSRLDLAAARRRSGRRPAERHRRGGTGSHFGDPRGSSWPRQALDRRGRRSGRRSDRRDGRALARSEAALSGTVSGR